MTVLDRGRALQILGLSEGADEAEIRSAHRLLGEHIAQRERASEDDRFRAARQAELHELESASQTLVSEPGSVSRSVLRWVLAWAIAATFVAVGLGTYVALQAGGYGPRVLVAGTGEGGGSGGSGGFAIEGDGEAEDGDPAAGAGEEVASAGERAKLVVHSPVEGAVLEVRTRGDVPELVAGGAADETVYWLAPGPYSLQVRHDDCQDTWDRDLDARGGDEHEFAPELCGDVGWMVVRSNVAGDELSIDGRAVGSTGERRHALAAGEHEVRVEKAGYQAWEGIALVEPGRVHGIRPRLEPMPKSQAKKKARPRPQVSSAPEGEGKREERTRREGENESWHEEARQWLLARYDDDRSGALDSEEELDAISCDQWLGLEQSHDQSRLGLSLTRFYGFDGDRWRAGALGVADEVRDLAYERMTGCGLR